MVNFSTMGIAALVQTATAAEARASLRANAAPIRSGRFPIFKDPYRTFCVSIGAFPRCSPGYFRRPRANCRAPDLLHHLHDFLQVAMEVFPPGGWSMRAAPCAAPPPPTIADLLSRQEPVKSAGSKGIASFRPAFENIFPKVFPRVLA